VSVSTTPILSQLISLIKLYTNEKSLGVDPNNDSLTHV
jgi:hypothetical protein